MSFTEWYEMTFGEAWHEDYALLYGHAMECIECYELWCKENNQKPIWNG